MNSSAFTEPPSSSTFFISSQARSSTSPTLLASRTPPVPWPVALLLRRLRHQSAELRAPPYSQFAIDPPEVGLDSLRADHQCGGDFFVRAAICGEPRDPLLGRGQLVAARRWAEPNRLDLAARLIGPAQRPRSFEDFECLIEGLFRGTPLTEPAPDPAEDEQAPRSLDRHRQPLVLDERAFDRMLGLLDLALGGEDQRPAARADADRPDAIQGRTPLLEQRDERLGLLDPARSDQRLGRVACEQLPVRAGLGKSLGDGARRSGREPRGCRLVVADRELKEAEDRKRPPGAPRAEALEQGHRLLGGLSRLVDLSGICVDQRAKPEAERAPGRPHLE